MKFISVEQISKSYGDKQLFQDITFTIAEKERIGLIGINGTGKSTLLKIIAGADVPDRGEIVAPNDFHISYSAQNPQLNEEFTVLEQVFSGEAPILKLLKKYEEAIIQIEQHPADEKVQNHLYAVQKEMDAQNGWDASTNAKTILTKLGIDDFQKKIAALSGGQKKRVALAGALIQAADLLILDEPTNHLDFDSVKWLENYLSRYSGALFIVTHDRYFLDHVANKIFELDQGELYSYKGNYAAFLEAKAIREENEAAAAVKQKNLFRRELEWIKRGAKARSTKQKARIQRFEQLDEQLKDTKTSGNLDISLKGSRLGKQVFEVNDASKKYGSQVILDHFHLLVKPGDRIGIIGKNGAGKSTLLNILAGKTNLDYGEIVIGQTVKIAYYRQESEDLEEDKRMIAYISETAQMIHTSGGKTISASQMLERFLFPPSVHGNLIRTLSGGEKRRLYLLKLLMTEPNVLFLDEPTNNLDTQTLTVLEDYLDDFSGVVLTVSHDRYFLDKVVDQLLILQGEGKIDSFYGNYSDYLDTQSNITSGKEEMKKSFSKTTNSPETKKIKMTFLEKKEWEEIDDKIAEVENRLEEINSQLSQVGSNFEQANELYKEEKLCNEQLEELIERWTYLAELQEQE
ncbi:ABC-F family ATP-binding cassette domain-containing protein [Bacillaceae bacterium Marseille-Q3522]|nr:ABC-F family ATP-binding cassette domain-containing protein [Bacillaceae bacterium Marseille-Q3522]